MAGRQTHVAEALCQGKLGQLIIANGIPEPYYPEHVRGRVLQSMARVQDKTKEDLDFAVQGLTVSEALSRSDRNRSPDAIYRQRARLRRKIGAATGAHLVRTAIEFGVVPFESVEACYPPESLDIQGLLSLGLGSHGLSTRMTTKTAGSLAETDLKRAKNRVSGSSAARDEGFARTPRMVYDAFGEGWFQPEQGGVLRPDAVQMGVQQMLVPSNSFTRISLSTV